MSDMGFHIESTHQHISTSALYIVGRGGSISAMSRPVSMEELTPWTVYTFILMCTKIITLRLKEVCRQSLTAESVEVVKCRSKRRYGNTVHYGCGTDPAPALLSCLHSLLEERIKQQVLQCRVVVKRLLDISQKTGTDDASTAPHQCDTAIIEVPAILPGSFHHQVITLCIRDDLGSVNSRFQIIDELLFISFEFRLLPFKDPGRFHPQLFLRRETAGEDRFTDQCERYTQVQRRDSGPFPRTLLSGCIEYLLYQG